MKEAGAPESVGIRRDFTGGGEPDLTDSDPSRGDSLTLVRVSDVTSFDVEGGGSAAFLEAVLHALDVGRIDIARRMLSEALRARRRVE